MGQYPAPLHVGPGALAAQATASSMDMPMLAADLPVIADDDYRNDCSVRLFQLHAGQLLCLSPLWASVCAREDSANLG